MVTNHGVRPSKWQVIPATIIILCCLFIFGCEKKPARKFTGQPTKEMYETDLQQTFAQAIIDGNLDTVKKMVASGADINARGKCDVTPLYFAIHYKKKDIYAYLLQHGADPCVELEYDPLTVKRYGFICFSTFAVAMNDRDPDYLVETMKYKVTINEDAIWELFAMPFFRPGSLRGEYFKWKEGELAKVDLAKFDAILVAGFSNPPDGGTAMVYRCLDQYRFAVVNVMLEKGWLIDSWFLQCLYTYAEKTKQRPDCAKIINYLSKWEPDILAKIQYIMDIPPDGTKMIQGKEYPVFTQQRKALKQLADELNAKRGIEVQQSTSDGAA